MYLFFSNPGNALTDNELASLRGSGAIMDAPKSNSFFGALFGEERPSNMLILLSVLVLLLHICGLIWLQPPIELTKTPAQPLKMEVSMITMSAPKPSTAVPLPPAPPLPVTKPEPIKPQVKPIPKKLPPKVQKTPDSAPVEMPVEPQPAAQKASSAPETVAPSVTSNEKSATDEKPFTEANFRANYASNPKPEYPSIAKSRDWQGKVMLRVQVSAEGLSDSVGIEKSSGHDILDEAAVEAVKKWRFIPAKHGETPVASSVIVPIVFSLTD